MGLKKWLMKQQWRIIQIRGIWSLFYGILLLAVAYYEYIPFFSDLAELGPFMFAGFILFVFLILGYLYDKILVMWAPSQEVTVERNPYMYVPSPKENVFWFPIYSALLNAMEQLAKQNDVDTEIVDETRAYFSEIQKLHPSRKEDIDKGIELREKFVQNHKFSSILEDQ